MFNLEKVHMIIDEMIVQGLIVETNQERILASMCALANQKTNPVTWIRVLQGKIGLIPFTFPPISLVFVHLEKINVYKKSRKKIQRSKFSHFLLSFHLSTSLTFWMIEKPSITENQTTSSSEYHYESQKIEEFEKSSAPSYRSDNLNQEEENHIQEGTHRGLDARHIQMISLGGAIG